MTRVAILLNSSWNIINFRLNIVNALQARDMTVVAVAPRDGYTEKLIELGCEYREVSFESASLNPIKELMTINRIRKALSDANPDVILNFTAKPNIYGSMLARLQGVPVINNVAGLGSGFVNNNVLARLLKFLYRTAFSKAGVVFFQNTNDADFFIESQIVRPEQVRYLPGSGIDLTKFSLQPIPALANGPFQFLMIARMLRAKGVVELIEAAERLHSKYPGRYQINLLGACDVDNKDAVSLQEMQAYAKKTYINYLGHVDNVADYLNACHCMVLPSYYREGLPRSLLEALAIGRPIITTDMPGCRETVGDTNGLLIEPRSVESLAEAMEDMICKTQEQLVLMGSASRLLAENKFSDELVSTRYLDAINEALSPKG